MDERYRKAYREVLYLLQGVEQSYIDKIPPKLLRLMEENADKQYECTFDYYTEWSKLDLMTETLNVLAMLYVNYWYESEEDRQQFIWQLKENDRLYKLKQYEALSQKEKDE